VLLAPGVMSILAHILKSKLDHSVYTITPTASVFEALKLMAEKNIGALVVLESDKILGMITERDYARAIVLMARSSKTTAVRDIMTTPVMYVLPNQTSEECMALMTEHRLRHFPVVDKGKLIGLISIGDLVKDVVSEQKFTIQQLQHYITGDRG
jgi:CBS domain-containing protein